ncbi:MAG: HigA family addiction module antitoxin [Methylobacter sp.]|nr:HigA family addiction module antitoxin [Methylobacter sp.]
MRMFNPPHPGEILSELWLDPLGLSITQAAMHLNVARKTVSELVNGKTGVSPEMAVRLELAFGKSAESWLAAQAAYDLWQLETKRESLGVHAVAA